MKMIPTPYIILIEKNKKIIKMRKKTSDSK